MKLLRRWFLQLSSCMFLFAFASLYVQIPGLYGNNGILPAKIVVKPVPTTVAHFLEQPSLVRYSDWIGISVANAMDLCCLAGIFFSSLAFLFQSCRTTFVFCLLWTAYLSVYELGQTFLWFQWFVLFTLFIKNVVKDILLLETGFLAILAADIGIFGPYFVLPSFPHSSVIMLLVRWLLFRLMFTSGLVKLESKCPTWWGLTALNYHYETQCISTPLAWYAHQLPSWFQKFSVASTFIIQIPMSLLFFAPFSVLVKLSFCCQVMLQLLIMLTGNYNFFNLTTLVLCLSLLDGGKIYNEFLDILVPSFIRRRLMKNILDFVGTAAGIICICWIAVTYFSVKVESWLPPVLHSKLNFTESDLAKFIDKAVPVSIFLVASLLVMSVVTSLAKAVSACKHDGKRSFMPRIYRLIATALFSSVSICMFAVACIPFCRGLNRPVPKPLVDFGAVAAHNDITHGWNLPITSSYGLFRRMTGVGGRPEVIIEASLSGPNGPWLPYEFMYKPGNVSVMPPVVAPHQPRLDWQMWFAALSSVEHSPWFLSLCERLLAAEPSVLALLAKAPFDNKSPEYIRANLYHYHFSSNFTGKYWWRRQFKSEFLPVLNRAQLQSHVQKMRISKKERKQDASTLSFLLDTIRKTVGGQPEGFNFLSLLFCTLVATRVFLSRL